MSGVTRREVAAGLTLGALFPLQACQGGSRRSPMAPAYPPLLDHLVWLAGDLDAACARFEAMSGIAPQYGGQHPGGTHNALVALGPACYLEIAAPQPGIATGHPWAAAARARPEPHLYAYCMRSPDSLETLAELAQAAGIATFGPAPGGRATPDGVQLRWRLLIPLVPAAGGAVPFFIDWLDSPHPAAGSLPRARLSRFTVHHPEPARMESGLSLLGTGVRVANGSRAYLRAEISCPRGRVVLSG